MLVFLLTACDGGSAPSDGGAVDSSGATCAASVRMSSRPITPCPGNCDLIFNVGGGYELCTTKCASGAECIAGWDCVDGGPGRYCRPGCVTSGSCPAPLRCEADGGAPACVP